MVRIPTRPRAPWVQATSYQRDYARRLLKRVGRDYDYLDGITFTLLQNIEPERLQRLRVGMRVDDAMLDLSRSEISAFLKAVEQAYPGTL